MESPMCQMHHICMYVQTHKNILVTDEILRTYTVILVLTKRYPLFFLSFFFAILPQPGLAMTMELKYAGDLTVRRVGERYPRPI